MKIHSSQGFKKDENAYIFNPLLTNILGGTVGAGKILMSVFTVIILLGIIIFDWPSIMLCIPLFLGIRIYFYKNTLSDFDVVGYKRVEIDCHNHIIYLDDEVLPIYDIEYAQVSSSPNSFWSYHGVNMATINFVNSEIWLYLKNGEQKSIPIQHRQSRDKMVKVLQEYIVVKFDEDYEKFTFQIWGWLIIVVIAFWLFLLLFIH